MKRYTAFQFQTGSIKSEFIDIFHPQAIVFQFQTGSIKRHTLFPTFPTSEKFQFQTGSIKSVYNSAELAEKRSFNSKLVRLKGATLTGNPREDVCVSIPNWFD